MKKILLCMLMVLPFVFTSCSDDDKNEDDISLGKKEYKMNFLDKVQIEATSTLDITYKTEDDFIATVSDKGLITGGRVGETEISLSNTKDTKKVSVIIEPKAELYPEPEFPFGETRANIIKKLGKPDSEDDEVILYDDYSSKAPYIMYMFDGTSNNSKLTGMSVIVSSSYSKELGAHLAERYLMVEGDDEIILVGFNSNTTEKATMAIGVELYKNTLWMVMYMPYSKTDKRSMPQIENTKDLFQRFDKIRK